jgi:dethiobiotin synthetase
MRHTSGLIVTGTDTAVGKTFVAVEMIRALRAQGVRVGAYKPVVSGARPGPQGPVWDDVEALRGALGMAVDDERISPQRFQAPLAPPVAARLEGRVVDSQLLRAGWHGWRGSADFIILEGAGGLLSPLTDTETLADLAADLQWPLIIVARLGLGTINHTLLTLEAAAHRQLPVAGIILNEPTRPDPDDRSTETNPVELARRTSVPILAISRFCEETALSLAGSFLTIDWLALACPKESVKPFSGSGVPGI